MLSGLVDGPGWAVLLQVMRGPFGLETCLLTYCLETGPGISSEKLTLPLSDEKLQSQKTRNSGVPSSA